MINKGILSLYLSLGLVLPVYAEENIPVEETQPTEQAEQSQAEQVQTETDENIAEVTQETTANLEQNENAILENAEFSVNQEKKPEFEVVYPVEKELVPMPTCDDEKLQNSAEEYIQNYFNTTLNQGTLFRRHKYFVLHNLDKFAEENLADYKTAETSPVSDIIANIKVNKGIIEENIRLCKNTSTNKYAGKIFLIIYPEDENSYRVNIINLARNIADQGKTTFVYAK